MKLKCVLSLERLERSDCPSQDLCEQYKETESWLRPLPVRHTDCVMDYLSGNLRGRPDSQDRLPPPWKTHTHPHTKHFFLLYALERNTLKLKLVSPTLAAYFTFLLDKVKGTAEGSTGNCCHCFLFYIVRGDSLCTNRVLLRGVVGLSLNLKFTCRVLIFKHPYHQESSQDTSPELCCSVLHCAKP